MKTEICYSDLILLTGSIERNVELLIEHGADKIELLMDGIEWDDMDGQIARLKGILRDYKVGYTVHPPAWDTSLTSENRAIREASYAEYKKGIEFAHDIQADHVVIHPGFCFSPAFDKSIARKRAAEYVNRLAEVAKPLGVKLVIENVGYKGTSIFNQEEYSVFLDGMDENVGYIIDTGHAHLNRWDIPGLIRRLDKQLFALHLHDNSGNGDEHLPIGQGTLNWEPIFDALKEIKTDCQLVLEYAPGVELHELKIGKKLLQEKLGLLI